MTEQIEQTEPLTLPDETVDTSPLVTITSTGNSVNISVNQGVAVWQAIGLLETALILLRKQYNTVDTNVTVAEPVVE